MGWIVCVGWIEWIASRIEVSQPPRRASHALQPVYATFMLSAIALMLATTSIKEAIVAGGPGDLMTVRHARITGTNEAIGQKLAEIARANHRVELGKATEDTQKQQAWAKANYPEMYARSQGVEKVYGTGLDSTALGYNLDIDPGCSVIYYPGTSVEGGHAMLSRNYDFPTGSYAEITGRPKPAGARSMTGDPYVLEIIPDKGYASLYVSSYDLLAGCIDGVNEKGLAVALLADDVSPKMQPNPGVGVNEISLTLYLLDRCANAKEARKALETLAFSYSFTPCHYMVCDASGDSFVWEISPDLKQRFVIEGKGKPQVVTNHLLSGFDATKLPEGNSFDRYRRLQEELAKRPKHTPDEVATNNLCVAVPTNPGHATLWHSVYDLEDRSMRVSFYLGIDKKGNARRSEYLKFELRR